MKDDYTTSTVDGAMGFARMNAEPEEDWSDRDDDQVDEEYYEEDDCNCSDPGCPCVGRKIGGV